MKNFILYHVPVVLYMGLVLIASILRNTPEDLPEIWQADKVAHLCAYFFMGLLWIRAFSILTVTTRNKKDYARLIFWSFFISFLYGFFIEVWQSFIPTRDFSLFDAAANGIGGFLGAYMYSKFLLSKRSVSNLT